MSLRGRRQGVPVGAGNLIVQTDARQCSTQGCANAGRVHAPALQPGIAAPAPPLHTQAPSERGEDAATLPSKVDSGSAPGHSTEAPLEAREGRTQAVSCSLQEEHGPAHPF